MFESMYATIPGLIIGLISAFVSCYAFQYLGQKQEQEINKE